MRRPGEAETRRRGDPGITHGVRRHETTGNGILPAPSPRLNVSVSPPVDVVLDMKISASYHVKLLYS